MASCFRWLFGMESAEVTKTKRKAHGTHSEINRSRREWLPAHVEPEVLPPSMIVRGVVCRIRYHYCAGLLRSRARRQTSHSGAGGCRPDARSARGPRTQCDV